MLSSCQLTQKKKLMKNAANSFKQVWNWHKFVTGTWLVSCWLFSSVQFQQLLFHSSLKSDIAMTLLNSDTGAARVNKQSSVNSHPRSHHWSHCDWLCWKGSVSYPSFTTGFDERSYAGSCLWILKWSCHLKWCMTMFNITVHLWFKMMLLTFPDF